MKCSLFFHQTSIIIRSRKKEWFSVAVIRRHHFNCHFLYLVVWLSMPVRVMNLKSYFITEFVQTINFQIDLMMSFYELWNFLFFLFLLFYSILCFSLSLLKMIMIHLIKWQYLFSVSWLNIKPMFIQFCVWHINQMRNMALNFDLIHSMINVRMLLVMIKLPNGFANGVGTFCLICLKSSFIYSVYLTIKM